LTPYSKWEITPTIYCKKEGKMAERVLENIFCHVNV